MDTDIVLRDGNGTLSVLDPVSGKPLYYALDGGKLHLDADQAVFVVADPSAPAVTPPAKLEKAGQISLGKTWTVTFEGAGAPSGTTKLSALSSLTESSDTSVKYFSGTATYRNTFKVKGKPDGISINLGEVGQMADVYINGEHAAFLWKAPYRVDWTGPLKSGKNTIEVRVVNLWVNRLIGDAQPGADKKAYTLMPFYRADSPLLPSGLIGPVSLEYLSK